MHPTLDTLNATFSLPGSLHFSEDLPGLPVAEIHTTLASARVALHGAQVLAWQPSGHFPVIWVSKPALYEAGKPVRGGVPICWPWFGAREGLPAHGFVRTRLWQVRESSQNSAGEVLLRFGICDDASTRALWDHGFDLELQVSVGSSLSMTLISRNTGTTALSITQALHSYFAVADISQTQVQGLEDTPYLDKVLNFAPKQQQGAVHLSGETDRIYTHTTRDCLIKDQVSGRVIRVGKLGSSSTVVWNPGAEREKSISDMAAGEYQNMLCVETCNAGPDVVTLSPGASHSLSAIVTVL
jgi:glucose-6-phosphate 1-epimerase